MENLAESLSDFERSLTKWKVQAARDDAPFWLVELIFTALVILACTGFLIAETVHLYGFGLKGFLVASVLEITMLGLAMRKTRIKWLLIPAIAGTILFTLSSGASQEKATGLSAIMGQDPRIVSLTEARKEALATKRELPTNRLTDRKRLDAQVASYEKELKDRTAFLTGEIQKHYAGLPADPVIAAKLTLNTKESQQRLSLRVLFLAINLFFAHVLAELCRRYGPWDLKDLVSGRQHVAARSKLSWEH